MQRCRGNVRWGGLLLEGVKVRSRLLSSELTSILDPLIDSLTVAVGVVEPRISLGTFREEPFPKLRSRPINPLPEPPAIVSCDCAFKSSPGVVTEIEPERNL